MITDKHVNYALYLLFHWITVYIKVSGEVQIIFYKLFYYDERLDRNGGSKSNN